MKDEGELHKETMVRFVRELPGPIERVWEFITSSEHLGKWFKPGSIEPGVGGVVNIQEGHIRGVVTQWKPPRMVTYTFNVFDPGQTESDYPESYLTIELEARGDNVLLTLTHRPIIEGMEKPTQMGWHSFLDMLRQNLRGEEVEPEKVHMDRNRARYGVT